MLHRLLKHDLIKWNTAATRKPLILQGARQVGKSYLLENFGRDNFPAFHCFNFEQQPELTNIFKQDLNPQRIIDELSLVAGKTIQADSDLIIFDEIQECPKALTSLKYFNEDFPSLSLACAGSLLGIALAASSFPVGKVDLLHLHPLNFEEFLHATGEDLLIALFNKAKSGHPVPDVGHNQLWNILKNYYITGGMPEVVNTYLELRQNHHEAFTKVRQCQQTLLTGYYKDFAKHAGKLNAIHITSVFENIPMQLANNREGSVQRYRFKDAIPGKKGFAQLRGPISWLEQASLLLKTKVCNHAEIPLELYCKSNRFKLFLFDIGLLGATLGIPPNVLLTEDYGTAKGYFAENFVAQELCAAGRQPLYSWTERNSEIEFLTINNDAIVPVEVKAGSRIQAKSLRQYMTKYAPEEAIIISAKAPHQKPDSVVRYVPLYLAGSL